MPFSLDSVIDLTRYVDWDHYQSKLDDKSGYDHVFMDDESRLYMGFQWRGWKQCPPIWLENFALYVSDVGHGGHARVASPADTLLPVY